MIDGKTSILGLLGHPVEHSLSPAIHNAALYEMGLNWCYVALPSKTQHLKTLLRALRSVDCKGLNITIPHKQSVASICKELSPLAKELGAVNTLLPINDEEWEGTNTDVEGFLAPLISSEVVWESREAVVIGCGGSARAVVAGLQQLGLSKVTVISRRIERLQAFMNAIQQTKLSKTKPFEKTTSFEGYLESDPSLTKKLSCADLVINTTPVGMALYQENNLYKSEIPLGGKVWKSMKPKTTFYDLIYTPRPTAWLALGAEHGHNCIDGLEMLIQQGAASLRLWSGMKDIPVKVMREAAKAALKT